MIRAIIFDLDGTLIDSIEDLTDSLNFALKELNLPTFEVNQVKKFVGEGMESLIKNAIDSLNENPEKIQQCYKIFYEHYEKNCTNKTKLFTGVQEFLKKNSNYQLGILTNKSEFFTIKILEHLQIRDFFSYVLTGDHPDYKKPNPYGIHKLLENWNLSNKEAILVGDHYTDIECAKNADINSIFAMYGYGYLKEIKPKYYIKSLKNLDLLLRTIDKRDSST
ncbi:MAG: HAD family hydrolase [Leptonema sp. (in: bacteria)]